MIVHEQPRPAYVVEELPLEMAGAAGGSTGWDYHTLVIPQGAIGTHRDEIDREGLQHALTEFGRLGWELMHVSFNQRMHLERDGHLLIFKRPRGSSRMRNAAMT
jgi:hypothetical protein